MRAQFLAQDRADLSEAVKSLTGKMKSPNGADMKDPKRLGRYLAGKPRVVNVFYPQRETKFIKIHCDSDHAGCLITRRKARRDIQFQLVVIVSSTDQISRALSHSVQEKVSTMRWSELRL